MNGTKTIHANDAVDATRTLRIVLHGAGGRMGTRIAACAREDRTFAVVRAIDRGDAADVTAGEADVVVDFSSPEGAERAALLAERLGCALLVGTTGLPAASLQAIERASCRVPAMIAPNTSLGVAVARRLASEAARLLPGFEADIVETHHARKLDAPSGTARSLAAAVGEGRGRALETARIHAIRAGDVVGEHVVTFSGPGERLSVAHSATNRDLFAIGALRMARWLSSRAPGMHVTDQWFADFCRA